MEGPRKLNPHAPPFYPSNPRHFTPLDPPPPPAPSLGRCLKLAPVPTGPRSRGGKFRGAETTTRRVADSGGEGNRDRGKRWLKRIPGYREITPLKPGENYTSVMIRNIPNNYTRELLVEFLENHCKHENEKDEHTASRSAFDFVYLPIDFKHRLNAGYAFVNFTSSDAAWRFHESVKGKRWDLFESKKIADVTRAKIQGKEALVRNFERMRLCSPSRDYLPVWFDPSVDGCISSSSSSKMHVIGVVGDIGA